MTFGQEMMGALGVLALGGICHWISTVNARIQSYAERGWVNFALLFLTGAGIAFFLAGQNISVSTDKVLAFSVLGLLSLMLSYLAYQVWQQGLDEESS